MIGYRLDGHDNGSHAFYDRPDVRRCAACGELLDKWNESLTRLRVRGRRKFDISATYDGVLVVSHRFRGACEANALTGLEFTSLPRDPDFSAINSPDVVQFDAERAHTQFINRCSTCGRYKEVIGPDPVSLKPGNTIPDRGFVRTDLEFASGDEKHPLILCGTTTGQILKQSGLKGLELQAI